MFLSGFLFYPVLHPQFSGVTCKQLSGLCCQSCWSCKLLNLFLTREIGKKDLLLPFPLSHSNLCGMQHFNYSLSHHRFKYLLSFQVISPIPLLLPNMLLISNNVRLLCHTICKALLEKGGQHTGENENILCVCVPICRNLLTGFPIASKRCWRADATICVVKGKQEFSAWIGVSCCAVSFCFPLARYLLCYSALLSPRAFLCSFMLPVLVLFPSLVQEGCSCRIFSMLSAGEGSAWAAQAVWVISAPRESDVCSLLECACLSFNNNLQLLQPEALVFVQHLMQDQGLH